MVNSFSMRAAELRRRVSKGGFRHLVVDGSGKSYTELLLENKRLFRAGALLGGVSCAVRGTLSSRHPTFTRSVRTTASHALLAASSCCCT